MASAIARTMPEMSVAQLPRSPSLWLRESSFGFVIAGFDFLDDPSAVVCPRCTTPPGLVHHADMSEP